MKIKVTKINVEFSNGSFEEWATDFVECDPADVIRWEQQYNNLIQQAVKEIYPYADVEVGETYNQLLRTKFDVDYEIVDGDEFDYEDDEDGYFDYEEDVVATVTAVIGEVTDAGEFWN